MAGSVLRSRVRARLGLALGAALGLLWPAIASASPGHTAQWLSRHPVAAKPSWKRYDEAPASATVRPVRVLRVQGEVTNPDALTGRRSGTTTLTYPVGGPAPSLVLDYGREVGGYGTFDIAATSGASLSATYSETLANLGNDGATTAFAFAATAPSRSDTFPASGPGTVTASYIQGGERYEQVTLSAPGSVTLTSAGIRFTPLRETPAVMAGDFLSSDDLLNRIWFASVYTLNLNQLPPGTSVQPGAINHLHLILDGAKRDRAVWSGDHLISDLTDYYASDPAYARDSDALFLEHPATSAQELGPAVGVMSQPGPLPGACSPNPLELDNGCITWSASYSMIVMTAVYNYYRYTGDLSLARENWPAIERQMAWDAQQVDSNGLFSVDSNDDADWNIESIPGELTYVNAVYYQALRSAARLAVLTGHGDEAKAWSAEAGAIRSAVNAKLWDAKTGAYDASTTERGSVVQDANVTAILAGIPSARRARGITRVLVRSLASPYGPWATSSPVPSGYNHDVSPYMGSFNVLSDFAVGNEAAALALIRREWGFMVNHDPGGVDWERIQPNGIPAGGPVADSTAHAWSTGPAPALSMYVLGVVPVDPGFATWRIAPQPGSLRWAQGIVPTPHGPIAVRWRRSGRRAFVLTVVAPRGTSGTVILPRLGPRGALAEDGRLVRGSPRVLRRVRGHHTFAWVSL